MYYTVPVTEEQRNMDVTDQQVDYLVNLWRNPAWGPDAYPIDEAHPQWEDDIANYSTEWDEDMPMDFLPTTEEFPPQFAEGLNHWDAYQAEVIMYDTDTE